MPHFLIPLYESNDCHNPAGSPAGGQFCSSGGSGAKKLSGTLAAYGWKSGVHENVEYDPAQSSGLKSWRFFAVTPTETWGAHTKTEAEAVLSGRSEGELRREDARHRAEDVRSRMAAARATLPVTPGPSAGVTKKPRLSIRASAYRDKPGFTISGRDEHGRRIRVFTKTRDSAERIRKRLHAGLHTRPEDFT